MRVTLAHVSGLL